MGEREFIRPRREAKRGGSKEPRGCNNGHALKMKGGDVKEKTAGFVGCKNGSYQ